jgi:DNA primase
LHQAKRTIRDQEVVGIVEGYTDVINMWQHGVKNIVATCGTSLTKDHVKKIDRWADEVFFIYDGDSAGAEATLRGANVAFERGIEVNIVDLPDGEDPDSFISEFGSEDPRDEIKEKTYGYHEFVINRAKSGGKFNSPVKQGKTIDSILKSVAKIPDEFIKDRYVREISEIVDTYDKRLFSKLEKFESEIEKKRSRRRRREKKGQESQDSEVSTDGSQFSESAPKGTSSQFQQKNTEESSSDSEAGEAFPLPEERVLLRLMLENGSRMVAYVLGHMALDEFTEGPPRDLARTLVKMYQDGSVEADEILSGDHGDALQQLGTSVLMEEHEASEGWAQKEDIDVPHLNQRPYEAAESAMKFLKLDRVNEALEAVREQMYQTTQQKQNDAVEGLQQKVMSLQKLRKRIKRGEFLDD